MRSLLYILGEFEDMDLDWIARAGHAEKVAKGASIVDEGTPLDAIYLVLSGKFSVHVRQQQDREVARLGTGEIIGHMSLLDSLPSHTSVTAIDDARVFVIPHALLKPKLRQDTAFGARFYRAIAVFLANWVQKALVLAGRGEPINLVEDVVEEDEISPDVLDNVAIAGARFKAFLAQIGDS